MVEKEKLIDKKFIPTIAAIAVLIILAIISFPVFHPKKTGTMGKVKMAFQFNNDDVSHIVINTPSDAQLRSNLQLKEDGNWYVNDRLAYAPEIFRILNVLKNTNKVKTIKEYGSLRDFGLFPPKKEVSIYFKDPDKEPLSIQVGDFAPVSKHRYAKLPGDDNVYLFDKYIYSAIAITPEGLLNKDIYGMLPDDVKEIYVTHNNETHHLVKKAENWYVTLPKGITVTADQDYVRSILSSSFGNVAKAVVKEKADDISVYKLDKPKVTVKVIDKNGKVVKTSYSDKIPSTTLHYVMNNKTGKIYVIDENIVSRLVFTDLDIRDKEIIDPKFDDINKVIFTKDGKDYIFTRDKHSLWHCKQLKLEVIDISQFIEDITTYYVDITSDVNIAESNEDFGFDKPVLKVQVFETEKSKDKNYKPYTIKIGKKSKEGYYYMQKSDDPYLYLLTQKTLDILTNMGQKKKEEKKKNNKEDKKEDKK